MITIWAFSRTPTRSRARARPTPGEAPETVAGAANNYCFSRSRIITEFGISSTTRGGGKGGGGLFDTVQVGRHHADSTRIPQRAYSAQHPPHRRGAFAHSKSHSRLESPNLERPHTALHILHARMTFVRMVAGERPRLTELKVLRKQKMRLQKTTPLCPPQLCACSLSSRGVRTYSHRSFALGRVRESPHPAAISTTRPEPLQATVASASLITQTHGPTMPLAPAGLPSPRANSFSSVSSLRVSRWKFPRVSSPSNIRHCACISASFSSTARRPAWR